MADKCDRRQIIRELTAMGMDPHASSDLLHPQPKRLHGYSNIRIGYVGLCQWIDAFHQIGAGLDHNIFSYKNMKHDHEISVAKQIGRIATHLTGKVVLAEITGRSRDLIIWPYTDFADDILNSSETPEDEHGATEVGRPTNPAKKPGLLDLLTPWTWLGFGTGSDAKIFYSAHMWGDGAPMMKWSKRRGIYKESLISNEPDDVLLHEMVHAGRDMRGVSYMRPVTHGWTNEEEFHAVIVTNIYMSEKGESGVMDGHGDNLMTHPDTFLDHPHIKPRPRELFDDLRLHQSSFWDALAVIGPPVEFNPIRQYDQELKKARR